MATKDVYTTVDSKDGLILVETFKGRYKGYKQSLLVNELNEMEVEFLVCARCKGVMRNACQIGNEQISVCEICAGLHIGTHPVLKQRKKILEIKAKCPLTTRRCKWNGTLADIFNHIDVCQEFLVECEYDCGDIFKRCELTNHLRNVCSNRYISCEYCQDKIVYKELNQHFEDCLELSVLCPINCGANIIRKKIESHIETDCPNTKLKCSYERFGCKEVVQRCKMEEHNNTKESNHLEMTSSFAFDKIERLENTIAQLKEELEKLKKADIQKELKAEIATKAEIKRVNELESKLNEITKTQERIEVEKKKELQALESRMENEITQVHKQQREENNRLSKEISVLKADLINNKSGTDSKLQEIEAILEKMTFPMIMHNFIKKEPLSTFVNDCGKRGVFLHSGPTLRYEIQWKVPNLSLVIGYKAGTVVNVWITVGNKFLKPMEYKFKLTLINNLNTKESLTFESPFIKLQPKLNEVKKGTDNNAEFPIAEIPLRTLSEARFRTAKQEIAFTLQIQEVEDFSKMKLIHNPIRRSFSTLDRYEEGASRCEVYSSHH